VQAHEKKQIALRPTLYGCHDVIGRGVTDFELARLERRNEKIGTRRVSDFDREAPRRKDSVFHRSQDREIIRGAKLYEAQATQIRHQSFLTPIVSRWEGIDTAIALTGVASLDNQGAKMTADHLKRTSNGKQ
jgi:hypothetical protein